MRDLEDIEAIKQLKARYFRSIDMKDWTALRQVFADDIVMDTTDVGGTIRSGADDCVATISRVLDGVVSVHYGHMPEIELLSDSAARGVWAMEDKLRWADGREVHGFGHYHETYAKSDDGAWRITTLTLTRLRRDFTP